MKSIESIMIAGDSLHELKKYHGAEKIKMRFERMVAVWYHAGWDKRFTYGRLGDWVCYQGDTDVCIPAALHDEFTSGWLKSKCDSLSEYYEQFAAEHADQIIQPTRLMRVEEWMTNHKLLAMMLIAIVCTIIESALLGAVTLATGQCDLSGWLISTLGCGGVTIFVMFIIYAVEGIFHD